MSDPLRDFLELPYDKLEEMNLSAKAQRLGACRCTRFRKSACAI